LIPADGVLFVGGYLKLGAWNDNVLTDLMRRARQCNCAVVLNICIAQDSGIDLDRCLRLLEHVDIFVPNEAPRDPAAGKWKERIIGKVDKCHNLKAADFDNDGDLDVLAAEMPNIPKEAPHPVMVFINQGDSLTWARQVLADYGNYSAQIGDIDNDGDVDIVGLRNHNRAPIEMWRNKTSDSNRSR
jgi:hypothetical protein